ncbi:STM3941 family protein [Caulobacter sp. Root1472]|uniref:STM3941 family protein n=1 Tax=Caulobacter sp. Root1472 TaxID=1736470 RepID=UPI0012E34852|nr:STM3941 family protein [Caulobacter sp. Root1472]
MVDSDTRVVATSRGKTALMCLGSVAFVAIGAWLVREPPSEKAMIAGWAACGCFSLTGLLGTFQLVWPPRLVLDSDGLTFHWLLATFHRKWTDIREIVVFKIKSTKMINIVANPGGKDLALGGGWTVSADELASLIEGYLARFGRANKA